VGGRSSIAFYLCELDQAFVTTGVNTLFLSMQFAIPYPALHALGMDAQDPGGFQDGYLWFHDLPVYL